MRKFTPTELRRMLGLTQKELADILGVSRITIARREEGSKKRWTVLEIEKLSQLSGIPVENITI